jgi:hypothetical protein
LLEGAAGVLVALSIVDFAFNRNDFEEDIVEGAEWLAKFPRKGSAQGLFTGQTGIALALAIVVKRYSRPDFIDEIRARLEIAVSETVEHDLLHGKAGVLWTGCLIASILENDWPLQAVQELAAELQRVCWQGRSVFGGATLSRPVESIFGADGFAGVALALARWGILTHCEESQFVSADILEIVR